jgi:cobalamin-dependent methionine synthase I
MYIVGECIHIISPRVKNAIAERDAKVIQDLARSQMKRGASTLDLNIGPQKKSGPNDEWMVNVVQEAVDAPYSF